MMISGKSCIMAVLAAAACLPGRLSADIPFNTSHPTYTLHNMRPDGFNLRAGGVDFLSDGRMAVSDWGADMTVTGKVFLLTNMNGTDRTQVQVKEFANGLKEPLGLKVVNDTIYVMCKDGLYMLPDANKDGTADEKRKVVGGWSYPPKANGGERWHLFAFGLLYKDGYFYGTLGGEYPPKVVGHDGKITDPDAANQGKDRGSLVKMDAKKGTFEVLTGGLRTPNGLGFGPEGEIFSSENNGHYMPSDRLNNLRPGRNYGMPNDPNNPFDVTKVPTSPPAVWFAHGTIGASPAEPVLVPSGPFKGQLFVADVSYGGLHRVFLEKVNNEWQGAVFRFAGGFEAGTNRLVWGPDGALYVGQIGNGGTNWGWRDKRYGLSKLVYNNKAAFDILAIRSRKNGMEVEFTAPVADSVAKPSKFQVRTWYNLLGQPGYGEGQGKGNRGVPVKSVQLSPDKKSVFLQVDSLTPTWVVHIKADVVSAKGEAPWQNEGWYTLNHISNTNPFQPPVAIETDPAMQARKALAKGFRVSPGSAGLTAEVPFREAYVFTVTDMQGRILYSAEAGGPRSFDLTGPQYVKGLFLVTARLRSGARFSMTVPAL